MNNTQEVGVTPRERLSFAIEEAGEVFCELREALRDIEHYSRLLPIQKEESKG